jgi:nucleotide-binding universal stress UspA family protein
MNARARIDSLEPAAGSAPRAAQAKAPVVVAVDGAAPNRATAEAAIELARASGRSVLFVYARRRPSSIWGAPFYQRRLSRATRRARGVLDAALRLAADAGIDADAEIVDRSR